jgi:uncharacterized protein YjbI with pentapeptide repeats
MTSAQARPGVVPIAIFALGLLLAGTLLLKLRLSNASAQQRARSVAVALEVIRRGAGGEARRRMLLEQLAAQGESMAGLDIRDAKLARIDLSRVIFDFANLRGADLRAARLPNASLIGTVIRKSDLTGADLRGADLTGADLSGATLAGCSLQRADLTAANLWGADLRGAQLEDARLVKARLVSADLRGANLERAQLFESDLFEADLRAALLRGAQLGAARMKLANLSRTDLGELAFAALTAADLRLACLDAEQTRVPDWIVFDLSRYRPPERCCELWPEDFERGRDGRCAAIGPGF